MNTFDASLIISKTPRKAFTAALAKTIKMPLIVTPAAQPPTLKKDATFLKKPAAEAMAVKAMAVKPATPTVANPAPKILKPRAHGAI